MKVDADLLPSSSTTEGPSAESPNAFKSHQQQCLDTVQATAWTIFPAGPTTALLGCLPNEQDASSRCGSTDGGSTPDQLPPSHPTLDWRPRPRPEPDAAVGSRRSDDRAADTETGTRPVRYEIEAPGRLVQVDFKKQGRSPDGGG